jgi:hypothetical protein
MCQCRVEMASAHLFFTQTEFEGKTQQQIYFLEGLSLLPTHKMADLFSMLL